MIRPLLMAACVLFALRAPVQSFEVRIEVDAAFSKGELKPIWRFFGYDEPNFTYMKDGEALLRDMGALRPNNIYVRTHHLLTSGDGTPALKWGSTGVYREDDQGNPAFDFSILDRIVDTWRDREIRPYFQLGFMPEALSTHPQDYPKDPPFDTLVSPGSGFSYPPKDFARWRDLCQEITRHYVEKYGAAEVERWYWEVWNEPNIRYWRGTRDEFFKLHDWGMDGVRRALPGARVAGPHTAGGPGGSFLAAFLTHCLRETNHATGVVGSPLDVVAFHAKGSPIYTNNHVRMGLASQLRNIDEAFAVVATFPELKNTPIVIGESDPEGCAACKGPHLGYRNGTMYSSYTAASFARKHELAEKHQVRLEGALTWAFEFENQPWFAGFRVLASNGVHLPVFKVFQMFSRMNGDRLEVSSSGDPGLAHLLRNGVSGAPDVSAFASRSGNQVAVMVWHYHDEDITGPAAEVNLRIKSLEARDWRVRHFRIDNENSNAYAAWISMGRPERPTPAQVEELKLASRLAEVSSPALRTAGNDTILQLEVPRQAVSLLLFNRE